MNRKIAVIFDMDGVIVDSNPYHKISLNQFFEKYGLSVTEEELHEKLYGRRNQEWIPLIFNKNLTEEEIEKYSYEKEALFRKVYANDVVALNGLEDFLKTLNDAAIPCAVGTSAPKENADFVLEKTGLGKYFDAVLHAKHVSIGKPHPDIYLKAANVLGFEPENCVVVEDSLPGVQAGLNAKAKVIGVKTTHTAEELKDCDLTIKDFTEISLEDLARMFN